MRDRAYPSVSLSHSPVVSNHHPKTRTSLRRLSGGHLVKSGRRHPKRSGKRSWRRCLRRSGSSHRCRARGRRWIRRGRHKGSPWRPCRCTSTRCRTGRRSRRIRCSAPGSAAGRKKTGPLQQSEGLKRRGRMGDETTRGGGVQHRARSRVKYVYAWTAVTNHGSRKKKQRAPRGEALKYFPSQKGLQPVFYK